MAAPSRGPRSQSSDRPPARPCPSIRVARACSVVASQLGSVRRPKAPLAGGLLKHVLAALWAECWEKGREGVAVAGGEGDMIHGIARCWWMLLLRGACSILFGLMAFAWP